MALLKFELQTIPLIDPTNSTVNLHCCVSTDISKIKTPLDIVTPPPPRFALKKTSSLCLL